MYAGYLVSKFREILFQKCLQFPNLFWFVFIEITEMVGFKSGHHATLQISPVSEGLLTWIDGAPNDTPQGVPGPVIKPVVEAIEALFSEESRRPVVKVRIKLVDDALESQHRKQARCKRCKKTHIYPSFSI